MERAQRMRSAVRQVAERLFGSQNHQSRRRSQEERERGAESDQLVREQRHLEPRPKSEEKANWGFSGIGPEVLLESGRHLSEVASQRLASLADAWIGLLLGQPDWQKLAANRPLYCLVWLVWALSRTARGAKKYFVTRL